jgi:hypothetical protein
VIVLPAEPESAAFFPGASPRLGLLPKAIIGEEGAPLSAKSGRPDRLTRSIGLASAMG